jgi:ABC-type ATPase with predicted acetyltransferase domain
MSELLKDLDVKIKFDKKGFTQEEIDLSNEIFGMFSKDIYFEINVEYLLTENERFINFFGISGSGKTVIKDQIKKQLQTKENIKILDFDEIENFYENHKDKTIVELFNIKSGSDKILRLLSGFGMFELRILTAKIGTLSTGQRTRLKYAYLVQQIEEDKNNFILIDEFLTFVDSLSSISFARSLRKYLEKMDNIQLFTFGVNDALINNFEDITLILGNTKINAVVKNEKMEFLYSDSLDYEPEIKVKKIKEYEGMSDLSDF